MDADLVKLINNTDCYDLTLHVYSDSTSDANLDLLSGSKLEFQVCKPLLL